MPLSGRPPSRRVALLTVAAVVALAALVFALLREGPDQTVVGVVSELELHQICVTTSDGDEVCAHVNSPASTADIDLGDCIRLERSPDDVFEPGHASEDCS